ncbi:MAG: hypothetical protein WAW96_11835 [Alphaproteobacteria bacterium]
MFREAYAIAREFTRPIVMSRLSQAGDCSCAIGSFVHVNRDGWIVTAAHILKHVDELVSGDHAARAHEASVAAIDGDVSLGSKERYDRKRALGKLDKNATKRGSIWWGRDGIVTTQIVFNETVDIGVAKLANFDPGSISRYPKFKNPSDNPEPGASLCKLGFPFHEINPTYDQSTDVFRLPPGAVPLPLFPMDGIFTRVIEFQPTNPPPYPLRLIETSSPGLKGQSGGPTFDQNGVIWAIQCRTGHLPLGFNPVAPGAKTPEHQFLNVGLGVHTATLFGLFDQNGIKYDVA